MRPSPLARSLRLAALLAAACVALPAAWAADTEPPAPRVADPLAAARMRVKSQQWTAAIDELKRVNATNNADWNNLMGYASRKQAQPDLDAAQRYYDAALRIDPQHRGALEYSGELALMKGDLPTAESRLAVLGKVCSSGCEELDDLKKAVAKFKATGKL